MQEKFDAHAFGHYTAKYENHNALFYPTTDGNIYYAAVDSDRPGMDGPDYVDDEILAELRREFDQFSGADGIDGPLYRINYYAVCHLYRGDFRL